METADRLINGIPLIVARWKSMTAREPWVQLSESDWTDHLPALLEALFKTAAADADEIPLRELVLASVTHGSHRRTHLFTPDALLNEYHLLRQAIWQAMSIDIISEDAVSSIIRIDAAISMTTVASLHGLYRAEPEDEPWEFIVEELVQRWPARALR